MEDAAPKSCCAMKAEAASASPPRLNVINRPVTPKAEEPEAAQSKLQQYRPLIVIFGVSLLAAAALSFGAQLPFMRGAMGLFLCLLASLQLFSLDGFAKTFAGYDVVAAKVKAYALAYPFIELALGFAYLAGIAPMATNAVMLALMLVGNIGVINVLRRGQKIQCACVGTTFSLPVGRVTLAENTVMGLMAAVMLLEHM